MSDEQRQRGRPRKENPNTTSLNIKVSPELKSRLQDYCKRINKPVSQTVREAIEKMLKQHNK